ncbi:MAG: thiol oxidoreductase [Saprospiraceae bacterium]|nr:thiol oxidoreductase [Saprospiraceae bacterium]
MTRFSLFTFLFAFQFLLFSCKKDEFMEEIIKEPRVLAVEPGEEILGGRASVIDISPNAFGFQSPGLEEFDQLFFFVGNSFFNQNWVASPASTTARDGLGPFFNARTCAGCHFKDGRGRPPSFTGEKGTGLLLRASVPGVSVYGGPKPDPTYGLQIQDQAVLDLDPEANFKIVYADKTEFYPDGTTTTLRDPMYEITEFFYGAPAQDLLLSPRVATQIIGLGLLDAIDEQTILDLADEQDLDGDGISGKPNYVWDYAKNALSLGRFGWKANEPNILQQVADAFHGDMGITSYLAPEEICVGGFDCDEIPNGGDTEIDDDDLGKVELYSSVLAVPIRRNWKNEEVLLGKALFSEIGCNKCHVPKLKTGKHYRFDALSDQTIRPYTDLLLHDMGPGLADHRPDFRANGQEWRTPPLWGIGLFQTVNDHTFYLHDGRARNLEEAILWHGGEAEATKEAFKALPLAEREAIIDFLNSL